MVRKSVSGSLGIGLTLVGGGMTFAFPGMLVPPLWGWIMLASGILLMSWSGLTWVWSFVKPPVDFDSVKAWSVSIELKGLQRGALEDGRPYALLHVELINHSSTQSRVLDISMWLESGDDSDPLHYVTTTGPPVTERLDELKALNVSSWLTDSFIPVPVIIPPNGRLWGYIEMSTSTSDQKYEILEIYLSERRSGIKKTLFSGECYDALRQRAYVGQLDHRPDRSRMRLADFTITPRKKARIMRGY